MSTPGRGRASAKDRRQQEIEEKKRRLREIREKKKDLSSQASSQDAAKKPLVNIAEIDNLDSLLNTISDIVPGAPPPPSLSSVEPSPQVAKVVEDKSKTQQDNRALNRARNLRLEVCSDVSKIDVPPKEIPSYSRSTQTRNETSPDGGGGISEDAEGVSVPASPVSPRLMLQQARKSRTPLREKSSVVVTRDAPQDSSASTIASAGAAMKEEEEPLPEDLSEEELRRICETPEFEQFFAKSSRAVERALALQDTHPDYAVDYSEAVEDESRVQQGLTLRGSLVEERLCRGRAVTDLSWSPKYPELAAVSYSASNMGWQEAEGLVLVWSPGTMLATPEFVFTCQSPVMSTAFSPFHPTMVVGGTYSGQLVFWDTRAHKSPIQQAPISAHTHTHPVYSLTIAGTTNANSLISISTDGRMCVWNLSNTSTPVETHDVFYKQVSATTAVGVTCMSLPEGEVNVFYLGSEDGAVYRSTRHGKMSELSNDEVLTQQTLWAISKAPYMMGGDLRQLDSFTLSALVNPEVLKVNSDSTDNHQLSAQLNVGVGSQLVVSLCGDSNSQKWRINQNGDMTLRSDDGHCADVWQCNTDNGNAVVAYECHVDQSGCGPDGKSSNQQWSYDSRSGTITSKLNTGKCLDVYNFNGPDVDIWDCNGGDNQQWIQDEESRMVSKHSGYCLTNPLAIDTARIWTAKGSTSPSQQYYVAMFNIGEIMANLTVNFVDLGISTGASCEVRDLWKQEEVGRFAQRFASVLNPHASTLISLTDCS